METEKKPLDSKKWTTTALGVGAIMLAGTAAVAWGGPLGVSALPYVVGGIVALCGGNLVAQGVQDAIKSKSTEKPQ